MTCFPSCTGPSSKRIFLQSEVRRHFFTKTKLIWFFPPPEIPKISATMESGLLPGTTVSIWGLLLSVAPESDVPLDTWAQDKVFRRSDILEVISCHNRNPLTSPFTFSVRQDLFSTTSTCRGFLAPCMDILWRDLDSLLPVLRLFPDFTYVDGS